MDSRLAEIERLEREYLKIIADATEKLRLLADERLEILTKTAGKKMMPLSFDDNVIRWDGGEVKLTPTSFDILSALWFAEKHRCKTMTLCEKVWGDGSISDRTLESALFRTRNALRSVSFPFHITAIKSRNSKNVKGYAIRKK